MEVLKNSESEKKMKYVEGKVFKIKVVNVPGDGNCLFYSVVQQITGWGPFINFITLEGMGGCPSDVTAPTKI